MGTITFLVLFLLVITILVVVHEAGHLLAAKIAKIKVTEFGIGFPPRLWRLKFGGTTYSINAIPLGGFVQMTGEKNPLEANGFASKSIKVRFLVVIAGVLVNGLVAFFLFSVLFVIPKSVVIGDILVYEVQVGSPAYIAGIEAGDVIREIDGNKLNNHTDLVPLVNIGIGKDMFVEIARGDDDIRLAMNPQFSIPRGIKTNILAGDIIISKVEQGSPAYIAGLQIGDRINSVDDSIFDNHFHLISEIYGSNGSELKFSINRDGNNFYIVLMPLTNPPRGHGAVGVGLITSNHRIESREAEVLVNKIPGIVYLDNVGISLATENIKISKSSGSVWGAVSYGFNRIMQTMALLKNVISSWLRGGEQPFSGPIGIGHVFVEIGQAGWVSMEERMLFVLESAALISMMLAIFNILPLPPLDGGRVMFLIVEAFRGGEPLSDRMQGAIQFTGLFILITLFLFVTFADISKLGDNLLQT